MNNIIWKFCKWYKSDEYSNLVKKINLFLNLVNLSLKVIFVLN